MPSAIMQGIRNISTPNLTTQTFDFILKEKLLRVLLKDNISQ
jgi:hypothetical protein